MQRHAPGQVRDAIVRVMKLAPDGLSVKRIAERVDKVNGPTPESSVRSYLRLNTPDLFVKEGRGDSTSTTAGGGLTLHAVKRKPWHPSACRQVAQKLPYTHTCNAL